MKRRALAAAGVVAVLSLSACSSSPSDSASQPAAASPSTTAPSESGTSAPGSATEIAFAQSMIPHHQQAVEMSDMALDPVHEASPDVKKLAKQIKAAQDPEIQEMTGWLEAWGAPTAMPSASGDMADMDHSGHDMGGVTMSGMMTAEQMQQLAAAKGQAFDTLWLQMMIDHHEGAIQMAEQVKAESTNPQVIALADAIITTQKKEIATMTSFLAP